MNLTTDNARALYMRMLDYFIMAADPQYKTLCSYAKKIKSIASSSDRAQLTAYFERETAPQTIDYFKNPNA